MVHLKIDGRMFSNMVIHANNMLEEQKEIVNAMNVFPVPDGDTGTNMSMTFRSAVMETKNYDGNSIGEVSRLVARGALMGARGNSGVILSQILRGIAKGLEHKTEVDAKEFGEALMEGVTAAYKAVMKPTEGTILTVVRAAGESAARSEAEDLGGLLDEVCSHSQVILDKTPEMLPVLKKAKVVDAGGKGLLILLEGMRDVLQGDIESVEIREVTKEAVPAEILDQGEVEQEIEYGYCTEFFIKSKDADLELFKEKLEKIGDSIIVVGSEDIVKVHVHTNEPGYVLSEALKLGELNKIKIDNMREQHRSIIGEQAVEQDEENEEKKKYAFVSVAMGTGIKNIFEDLGVDAVIEGGQTMNPSTQDILSAVYKLNAEHVFILPNNKNIIMAATQAAELSDKNVHVIQTKTIPQGITAITVFNGDLSPEENVKAMNESVYSVSSGSVTYAVRDTEMDGIEIKEGDILGLIEGKIKEVGQDPYKVADDLLSEMVTEESELITVFYGSDCDPSKVEELMESIEEKYSELDVQYYDGGQPLYYFLVSVE
ncbi:MAG: dihydroxyacetone kinase [Firmicutes bacterium]|nr:dihydroxyacetone kinase [Bacillota bacterium]